MNENENDTDLRRTAQRLGARAAERLDVERTAAAVLRRLREQPLARRRWWRQPGAAWLRLAAALALLTGGALVYRAATFAPRPCPGCATADGANLSPHQLRGLLQALDQAPAAAAETPAAVEGPETGLEDLTATQLRDLLHSLEG